jgi:glycine/D-amino acid oxidase-like deaminating enzyme
VSQMLSVTSWNQSERTPYQVRSLWLQQALDALPEGAPLRAQGSLKSDICIVGGGFVGLWTAWHLMEADAGLDIAIVEGDICGGGASGRNTGQILPLWSKIKTLEAVAGRSEGGWIARASEETLGVIESFCNRRAAKIGFRKSGWLWLASAQAQESTWENLLETCAEHGATPFTRVSAEEGNARAGSNVYRGGVFMPGAAVIQPAMLARELRRELIERGVRVYEESPMRCIELRHGGAIVRTPAARIEASKVVLALGGWSRGVRELSNWIVTVGSEIIATEPIPKMLDESGWRGYEPVTNARLTLRYTRRTDDGRVLFGRAGTSLGFGSRLSSTKFEQNPTSARALAAEMPRFVPSARDAKVTHAWIGPVDRTQDGLPAFGALRSGRGRILYAAGFSGNGVGPAILAARSLTSLALGRDDKWGRMAFVNRKLKGWPPEPIRFLVGESVRLALAAKESREEEGKGVPWAQKLLAKLAPGGLGKDDTKRQKRV